MANTQTTAAKADDGLDGVDASDASSHVDSDTGSEGYETADNSSETEDNGHSPKIISDGGRQSVVSHQDDATLATMDQEVANALREWRRQSLLKIDWGNLFSTKKDLWRSSELFVGNFKELLKNKSNTERTADALWNADENFMPRQSVASFLGQSNRYHKDVLQLYLAKFDFADMRLDEAFRRLCGKLYFRASAPEIDRILEAFAKRYWACNLHEVYGSADIVHIVTHKLFLLNTDLHLSKDSNARVTLSGFCKDAFIALNSYESSARTTILAYGGRLKWQMALQNTLEELFLSVKREDLFADRTQILGRSEDVRVITRLSKIKYESSVSSSADLPVPRSSVSSSTWTKLRRKDMQREKMGPYKEGPLACKCIKHNRTQEASYWATWKPCWVILDQGFLRIFLQPIPWQPPPQQEPDVRGWRHYRRRPSRTSSQTSLNDNQPFLKTQVHLGHALICPAFPSHDEGRLNIFQVELNTGTTYLFDCGTDEQAKEWVSRCNYWAARESRIPVAVRPDVQASWKPPVGASLLSKEKQWEAIRHHLAWLRDQMQKATAENDSWKQYLKHEIKRYSFYELAFSEQSIP